MNFTSLVLDASTTLNFTMPDEQNARAYAVRKLVESHIPLYVPKHWLTEVTNGLLMAERQKRITAVQVEEILTLLTQHLSLQKNESAHNIIKALTLARRHQLTIYDAAYLELAIRTDSALATTDRALLKAAKAERVDIV
ncbi:MAG: type II toxin-antitoxin system VapC family toxin [Verrucomicrobiales bacterium]|jgi:predicted nucleic acid-binding protein|nr:type II toxin-antitoxin system VapC family toxin [Verrucomicrobiales bacterium]